MNKNGSKTVRSRENRFTAWPWRDGRNRNRKEQQRLRSRKERRRGVAVAWHGAQGRTVLCLQVHACKAAGRDDGSQQHTAGNRRPGGSTGQEFSVLLPGRTGGSSGLQVRSTCACTQGKGGARSGGNGGRGLGPAAAWLAVRKKTTGGRCLYRRRWRVVGLRTKRRVRVGPARIGLRSGCEEKKKRNGPDC